MPHNLSVVHCVTLNSCVPYTRYTLYTTHFAHDNTHFTGVGKHGFTSRDLQHAFSCKAAAIVFYTEMLEKMGALKMLIVLKSFGKQVSREHYWFHHSHEGKLSFFFLIVSSCQVIFDPANFFIHLLKGLFGRSPTGYKPVISRL